MLNVRLAGAPISNAGRLEVFYLGGWGTVDYWGWDLNAAHVVCRQLGYPASLSFGYNNQFGSRKAPRWFTNLRCFGNETNLGECTKDVYGYTVDHGLQQHYANYHIKQVTYLLFGHTLVLIHLCKMTSS